MNEVRPPACRIASWWCGALCALCDAALTRGVEGLSCWTLCRRWITCAMRTRISCKASPRWVAATSAAADGVLVWVQNEVSPPALAYCSTQLSAANTLIENLGTPIFQPLKIISLPISPWPQPVAASTVSHRHVVVAAAAAPETQDGEVHVCHDRVEEGCMFGAEGVAIGPYRM